jgi:xanthine dehydrogenase accessory factor
MQSRTGQQETFRAIRDLIDRHRPFVLATVLDSTGSTPVKTGARAVIVEGRVVAGTVGGGAVEAEAERRAVEALASRQLDLFQFHLSAEDARQAGPICGGVMRLLLNPAPESSALGYAGALDALERHQRGLLVTTLGDGQSSPAITRWLPESDLDSVQDFPGAKELRRCLQQASAELLPRPASAVEPAGEVFIEPVIPRPTLILVGGGHVGQAVAAQASLVGFDVVVIEDREAFARPDLFPPGVSVRCGPIDSELAAQPFGLDTFVVLVTRGHRHDAQALEACIHRPTAYIGMIGSRRKVRLMRQDWIASGRATAEEFDRVYAPIGLDLGAVTPPEIATSVVAQLIAVRRKGNAPRLPLT